jgi:hypothetical protein
MRLAAAGRVESGLVERHRIAFNCRDMRSECFQVRVGMVQ